MRGTPKWDINDNDYELQLSRPVSSEAACSLDQVQVTLQLTVSQPVRLGVEPLLGLMTRFYFVIGLTVTVLCLVGRPI
jgi:hypothetical protein